MIDLDYAARQMTGVWKMAWNRPDWTAHLDRSVDGVFRSFWGIVIAAPFAFLGMVGLRQAAKRIPEFPASPLFEAPLAVAVLAETLGYIVDWAASLAALVMAARAIGASRRVADAIIGFNWIQPMLSLAGAAPLAAAGILAKQEVLGLLLLPTTAFVIALTWGMLRRSLGAGVQATIAIFILLLVVGMIVRSAIAALALGFL